MIKIERLHFLFILSFLLLTFDYFGLLKDVNYVSAKIILPVKKEIYASYNGIASFGFIIGNFPKIQKQVSEFENLQKLNAELNLKVVELSSENIRLRQQLEAPLPPSFNFLPAEVISVSRYMEIWAPQKEKIKSGMVVLDGTTLIGKVISVSSERSQIQLANDKDAAIPAKTSRGAKGVVTGQTGGAIVMEKVLQKDPLFIDDLVMTEGRAGFPPDLLIGKIVSITSDDVSPYKQAKVSAPLDYSSLKSVFILTAL